MDKITETIERLPDGDKREAACVWTQFGDGSLTENEEHDGMIATRLLEGLRPYKFCPYCGKSIEMQISRRTE